jgi:hypothetical protein
MYKMLGICLILVMYSISPSERGDEGNLAGESVGEQDVLNVFITNTYYGFVYPI